MCLKVTNLFLNRVFRLLAFTFRSVIHSKFFLHEELWIENTFSPHMDSQLFEHNMLKRLSLSHGTVFALSSDMSCPYPALISRKFLSYVQFPSHLK